MKVSRRGALLLAVITLVAAGCGPGPAARPAAGTGAGESAGARGAPRTGGTFVHAVPEDARILIPTLATDPVSQLVNSRVYDSLLTHDDRLHLLPGLARSYTVRDDRVYVFELRDDVRWHDGAPLTARDAVFTFQSIQHPTYTGTRAADFLAVRGTRRLRQQYEAIRREARERRLDQAAAEQQMTAAWEEWKLLGGFRQEGEHRFVAELEEPFAPLLASLGLTGILPAHRLESWVGARMAEAPEAEAPVGTGAYRFRDWVRGEQIVLERNPDWKWGAMATPARIDRVILRVMTEQKAVLLALEEGEADHALLTLEAAAELRRRLRAVQVYEYPSLSYTYLGYNLLHPLFADPAVRRAIAHALNRQEMVERLLGGYGLVAHTHGSPVRWDHNPHVATIPYDRNKADQLFDAAGWRRGPDGVRAKDGRKFRFTLAVTAGNQVREQAAQLIQQALRQTGIEVLVERLEPGAFLAHLESDRKAAYLYGWTLGFDPDPHAVWHSRGIYRPLHGYSNPEADELIEKGRAVTDPLLRREIYSQLQKLLAEEHPSTWLFFHSNLEAFSRRVKGLMGERLGTAGPGWHRELWWLEEPRDR
jgi:peptide/nickel transport system substrate-binding protein